MLPNFFGSQSVLELDSNLWIVVPLCPIHIRDDLVDLILLLFRTCHQHQLRGCYSCSLFCMFLYIFFSRYSSTTRITAMKCDVSAYVVLIMCNSSCFLHKVHQFQPICYYQSVWRGGGWSRAVCSVGIFFTSFQPSPQISSYAVWRDGDDLEDISNVEIQIENCLSSVRTKITVVRVISDEEWSCSVPVWITSTGKEKKGTWTGLLFDVLHGYYRKEMIGAVFDVGRVSWFQCGLLHESFSLIVVHKNYKRRGFVQSLMRKRVSLFQCGFLHQDWFLTVLHRYYKRRKVREKK